MEFKTTKEFIIQAHSAACTDWKKRIEKEFPEAFKTQLEVGKWYVLKNDSYDWLMNYQGDGNVCYGFTSYKHWANDYIMSEYKGWREATHEEVKAALIAEAKKRFGEDWENAKVKECLCHGCENYINVLLFSTVVVVDRIWNRNAMIFNNGVWAEPLPEEKTTISKEKALKIIAKKLKVSPENIVIE